MVRVGLTIYLAFSTVAGPLLCCCTTSRLFAGLFPSSFNSSEAGRPAMRTCCQAARVQVREPGVAFDGAARPPAGNPTKSPHKQCPCRESTPEQPTALAAGSSDNATTLARLLTEIPDDAPWTPAIAPDSLTVPTVVRECPQTGPFLTTRELLRAHHVLRC
ncbi:MAG: hypothetical protein U0746_10335 [Gemmataceae bacterium]